MMNHVPLDKAYRLLNTGAVILVCTRDSQGAANLAPLAWHCPLEMDPVTRVLMVCDLEHKTASNIRETGKYVIAIPHASQVDLVTKAGSISGYEVNKFDQLHIDAFESQLFGYPVPDGSLAYLECRLDTILEEHDIILGTVLNAAVCAEAFQDRLLAETPAGKTLHHLGEGKFMIPGDKLYDDHDHNRS